MILLYHSRYTREPNYEEMSLAIKVRCSRHECVVSLKLLEPKGEALHIRAVKNLNARRVFLYLNTRLCGIQYSNKSNKSNSGAKNNRYALNNKISL